MIVDNIRNYKKYIGVNPRFEKAFAFIEKAVKENLEVGKYEIEGDDIRGSISEYVTKDEKDCKYEGHRKYIDIQYIISGVEVFGVCDISKMTSKTEYDEQKDYLPFENCEKQSIAVIEEGEYGIFFPNDIHKPGISFKGEAAPVKKIVVKVKA